MTRNIYNKSTWLQNLTIITVEIEILVHQLNKLMKNFTTFLV